MINKILLILIFMISGLTVTFSQTINGKSIEEIDVEYIEIVGTSRLFSKKVNIHLDFGQSVKFFSLRKENQIKDINGKRQVFNSMIDALNFMNNYGYEFVQAYAFATKNQNVYHYLMKKRKN